jgi:hypothetical protein
MVGSYIFVDLGYIEVASMSANKQFKAMAHYPVFCHFGKAPKEKFGRPGNHCVNSRKKYQLTPKIHTLSQVSTHLYPPHFISAQEAKTAKVAQYPVTDEMVQNLVTSSQCYMMCLQLNLDFFCLLHATFFSRNSEPCKKKRCVNKTVFWG